MAILILEQQIQAIEVSLREDDNNPNPLRGTAEEKAGLRRELLSAKGMLASMRAVAKYNASSVLYSKVDSQGRNIPLDVPATYLRDIEALFLEAASFFGEYAREMENKSN